MDHFTPGMLASWQNFYVIAGSAAGALTGLQFVVMTLVAQARAAGSMREIHAFGTPTVMHFCTSLVLSAVMTSPWQSLTMLGGLLAVFGLAGVVYSFRVLWHARQTEYRPDLEDWIWYVAFPVVAHLMLLGSGVLMFFAIAWSPTAVAVDTLVFLLLGVHNSWDTVTYVAVQHRERSAQHG
jgi:hypothetical protein